MATKKPQAPYLSQSGPALNWDAFEQYINEPLPQGQVAPKPRSIPAAVNDTVIDFGNAVAGGVSSAASFVSPGNRMSKYIDKNIIEAGRASQSDATRAEDARYAEEMQSAQGMGDEAMATLGYVGRNPIRSAATAAGSFVGPGLGIKGAQMTARALGAAQAGVTRAGLAGGAVAGAALSGGDAAGTAYELAIKAGATEEQAVEAAREASVIPAAVGGAGGLVGAERIFAGANGFAGGLASRALKTGAVEAAQEGFEEGVTQYEGQRAAMPFDPSIDPMKGVAGAATMGAALGGITGGGVAALSGKSQAGADLREQKMEERGPLTRAANRGIEAQAEQADAEGEPPAPPGPTEAAALLARANERAAELDTKAKGTKDEKGEDGEVIHGTPKQFLTPDEQEELEFLKKSGGDAAALAARYGVNDQAGLSPEEEAAALQRFEVQNSADTSRFGTARIDDWRLPEAAPDFGATDPAFVDEVRAGAERDAALAVEEQQQVERAARAKAAGEAPVVRAPRTRSDAVDLTGIGASDPVAEFVAAKRTENTPAARAYVKDFEAGRITPADVTAQIERGRALSPDERLARAASQAPKPAELQPGDILAPTGRPWPSRGAARLASKRQAGSAVADVAGGFVVRPAPTAAVDAGANEAATSPTNDLPEPTDAQREAGNFKVGRIKVAGLDISVEYPKGSERVGRSPDGKEWRRAMKAHYGYVRRTEGADGEQADVYVGAAPDAPMAFVIDQVKQDGGFDETKSMLGFKSQEAARRAYLSHYPKGWKIGGITPVPVEEFKAWLKDGDMTRPFAERAQPSAEAPATEAGALRSVASDTKPPVASAQPDVPARAIVEHATGKGSVMRGALRSDMTLADGKAIDPGSFKKDGGVFIRERSFGRMDAFDAKRATITSDDTNQPSGPSPEAKAAADQAPAAEAGDAKPGAAAVPAAGAGAAVEAPGVAPKPRSIPKKAAEARAARAARESKRAEHFTLGSVLRGYGGLDRVLDYRPQGQGSRDGTWEVQVQRVVKQGDAYVPAKGEAPRWHSTEPNERELKAGPVERSSAKESGVELPVSETQQKNSEAAPASAQAASGIAGNEEGGRPLKLFSFDGATISEQLAAAKDHAKINFVGRTIRNDTDDEDITIPASGIKHALSGQVSPVALAAVRRLDVILKTGRFVGSEPDKKNRNTIKEVRFYERDVDLDGLRATVRAVVRVAVDGARFYDHFEVKEKAPSGQSGKPVDPGSLQPFEEALPAKPGAAIVTPTALSDKPPPGAARTADLSAAAGQGDIFDAPTPGQSDRSATVDAATMSDADIAAQAGKSLPAIEAQQDGLQDTATVETRTGDAGNVALYEPDGSAYTSNDEYPEPTAPGRAPADQTPGGLPGAGVRRGDSVQRRTVRALGIARDLEQVGATHLVGRSVRSAEDVAQLAQVYRNPRYEVFRVLFTRGDEIVHASGVTLRLPGQTPVFPSALGFDGGMQWMADQMQGAGADGYYILHNHPSGNPTPSESDKRLTEQMAARVPGMKAHVVINSTRFATITPTGTEPVVGIQDLQGAPAADRLLTPSVPSALLGARVTDSDAVARLGKSVQAAPGMVTLIGQNNAGVRGIFEVPAAQMRDPMRATALVRRYARLSGSTQMFAYGERGDFRPLVTLKLLRDAYLLDVVYSDGGRSEVDINGPRAIAGLSFGLDTRRGGQTVKEEDPPAARRGSPRDGAVERRVTDAPRVAEVKNLVERIRARWANAPEVVVVKSRDDRRLPDELRNFDDAQRSEGAEGKPEGFFYDGKVYLIADQLGGDADVLRVLMHEALGHYGLRGTFGQALGTILDRIAVLNAGKVRAKARQYGLDFEKQSERRMAAEEVLAEMAQTSPQLGWVKRAVAAIRSWLREHAPGFAAMRYSDAEIVRNFLEPASRFVKRGPDGFKDTTPVSRFMDGPMAMRAPRFTDAVRSVLAGDFDRSRMVAVSTTPEVLQALGVKALPVITTAGVIDKMHQQHGLPESLIGRLPELLADPAMVFASDTEAGSFVVIADELFNGNPLLMAVHPDQQRNRVEVNVLASAYDKRNPKKLQDWIGAGLLRYSHKAKSRSLATTLGLQLPRMVQPANGTIKKVLTDDDVVKRPAASRSLGERDVRLPDGYIVGNLQAHARAAGNKLAEYRGLGLQALGRRQLVDLYAADIPALTHYSELVQQMDADKNEAGAEADKLATDWGKLPDERQLAELMHDATVAQIDPAEALVEGDDERAHAGLSRRFSALSPGARTTYKAARDSYMAHWEKVQAEIKARIERAIPESARRAEMLTRMDAEFFGLVKGVYFPLSRFGDYVIVAKDSAGKAISVTRAETINEAEAARRGVLAQFKDQPSVKVGKVLKSKEFSASRDAVSRGFIKDLFDTLNGQEVPADVYDSINQLYLESLPDLSWAKHGIHRKGTPGFSQDARRAFAQHMFHGARYLAKLRYSDRLADGLDAMQSHIDSKAEDNTYDSVKGQQVVDQMVERHESLMNPKTNSLSTALTSLGFIFHLGLSPASAMVNLSQTAFVAYPIMGAKWGFGKASAALLAASKQAAINRNDIGKVLDGDEKRAYEAAVSAGTIDVTMAHDLAGISQGEDAKVSHKLRPVMKAASFLFHHAERFNRQVTFVAAYRLAREAGAAHDAAFQQATKATYDGHFDYGAANRPLVMQGNAAKVLLLFKQYGQNMVYTLVRQAQLSLKGATPADRTEARKALSGLLVMHAAGAGVLGLPLVTTLLAAASMFGSDDDEPWDAQVALRNMLADTFGRKPAEVMAHGLSRLTPWDISGRVGLDHLLLPDVREGLEGQNLYEAVAGAALGPIGGIAANALKGLQHVSEGRFALGLETMMPTALRGPMRAYRYGTDGAVDKTGIPIKDDVSAAAIAGQALGLSPSEVREATEAKGAIYQADRRLMDRRKSLMAQYSQAKMAGDDEGVADARKEISAFNKVNPKRRIDGSQMAQSVRARLKRIRDSEAGVYLPAKRRDALEAGRFATMEN